MDNVIIIDDFFDKDILNDIVTFFKTYDWKSLSTLSTNTQGSDVPFWRINLNEYSLFSNCLTEIIKKKFKKNLSLIRVYAVCQTYGQTSNFHTDSLDKNHYTLCYYINENVNDSGHLYIRDPKSERIMCIEPIINRGVFFPSNYIHKGTELNNPYTIRVCIAWKLEELLID